MRAVVQRVREAEVIVEKDGRAFSNGKIGKGITLLIGVGKNDTMKDIEWMADKIVNLRIFPDEEDKMNRSLLDIHGEILAVSQFTLYGDCRKGRRPSYSDAGEPVLANGLYEKFIEKIKSFSLNVEEGVFQASMLVKIYNDGPVTLLLDSEKTF